jgi:L-alanine-DL-glutamate epimerase-like enolase superfamily enzyme
VVNELPVITDGAVAPLDGPGLGLTLRPELWNRPDATVRFSRA